MQALDARLLPNSETAVDVYRRPTLSMNAEPTRMHLLSVTPPERSSTNPGHYPSLV